MAIILRQLRGSGGNQTLVDRRIDADEVTIGRGADRDILANDPRVTWEHASLRLAAAGKLLLELESGAGPVMLNGAPVRGGKLKDGDELLVGNTQIVPRWLGERLYLEVTELPRAKDQGAGQLRAQSRLSLTETGVSKRRWSWVLFLLALGLTLLLPLGARLVPGGYAALKSIPFLPVDAWWNSGPISTAHQGIADQCNLCHLELFERVPDRACAECHAGVPHHDDDLALLGQSGIEDYRCADCHHEHGGDEALILAHPTLCTDCHADPAGQMPGSPLLAAADFDGAHPEFSPQVWMRDVQGQRQDVSTPWEPGMREQAALIYPHDLHLVEEGVEDSQGQLQQLQCADCHVYQSGQISFKPVDFEQHCQACHSLAFDPAFPERQLPHGNTQAVLDYLRGYFARQVLEGTEAQALDRPRGGRGRDRSSGDEKERRGLFEKADGLATDLIDESIRIRLCSKCHTIDPPADADGVWSVTPFQQRAVWMTAARFDHSRHQATGCGT
ncbi:MAG: FHA domain-containing protein, partial [Oceanococcaceae bacterium]